MTDRTAETVHMLRRLLGDDMRPVQEQLRGPTKRPIRKRISARQCSGKEIACLPGKGDHCIACANDD